MVWNLYNDTTRIATVTTFAKVKESTKIVSKALDGTVYLQTVGTGTDKADVGVFAKTWGERNAVNEAAAAGTLVHVVYREGTYYGYIEADPKWKSELAGQCYSCTLSLLLVTL